MRVIGGSFKGRTISFTNSRYDNADITPQMVKEALFDIISAKVREASFLDLFSCSGQIGLEALSRGAAFVLMNEKDRKRLAFIKKMKADFDLGDECLITGFDYIRCGTYCRDHDLSFDLVYVDPPYVKNHAHVPMYDAILEMIASERLLKEGGLVIVQHFIHNKMSADFGSFHVGDTRTYGQNTLTFYSR